jgi:lysophospholipase L1-like esterase
VRTNDFGFREGTVDPSGRRNVLLVGDSVVWGTKVLESERFSTKAAALLKGRDGMEDVQVINAGVPAFSSFQTLQFVKDTGIRVFRPEVLVICVGINDSWMTSRSDRAEHEENMKLCGRLRRLARASDLLLFLNRYIVESVVWVGTGHNLKGFSLFYGDPPGPPRELRSSPAEAVAYIREAGELAEASGGHVVLMLEDTSAERPPLWFADCFQEQRDRLDELARHERWTVIDMAALREPPLELPDDRRFLDFCHPTPEAHAILGYLVAEAVAGLLGA